jgi:YVTN family beta-propeller protein
MDRSICVLPTFLRSARIAGMFFLITVWAGCGDTFRPVAIPIIPTPPSPSASHSVLVIDGNGFGAIGSGAGPINPGSSSRLDVSGDTNVGIAPLGLGPVHAALLPNSSQLYVANFVEDTVSSFAPSTIGPVTTISLPPGSQPVFVHTTENGTVYVANYGYGTVAAISTTNNVVSRMIPADPRQPTSTPNPVPQPVALAETPDGKKLYIANLGNSSVTSVNTIDSSVGVITDRIVAPAWVVARSDSARVYVLNSGSGTVSVIDTATDLVIGSVPVGPSINCAGQLQSCGFMLYDKARTRLYVTNPASTKVAVLDASTDALTLLAMVDLTTAPNSVCVGGCSPLSITVLPDGSRAYAATYQLNSLTGTPYISAGVTVINTSSNTAIRAIALGSTSIDTANPTGCGPPAPPSASPVRFRLSSAAAADGTRVYISSCDMGTTSIIHTFPGNSSSDSLALAMPAPASDFQPSTVTITGASPSGADTTYTYQSSGAPALRPGMNIVITGMHDAVNDGTFAIIAVGPGTFSVANPSGVAATGQNGSGTATTAQNPVFTLAGP